MKLIELLVQELPKRGGWPEGAITADAFPYEKGLVNFFDENGKPTISPVKFDSDYKPEKIETVTREQYEAALASTQRCVHEWIPSEGRTESGVLCRNCGDDEGPRKYEKMKEPGKPVWDGEGLPPVGCECEMRYRHALNAEWVFFRCVAVDCEVAFGWAGKEPVTLPKDNFEFRPIRTERDKAIEEMRKLVTNYNKTDVIHAIEQLYDAGYRKLSD